MNEDGAPFDSGFDDAEPFRVSPESGGVSLESALRDFGPAAIDDLIPRIRAIAASLDAAHRAGVVHGALHPSKVFVTDKATYVIAGKGSHAPYAAPEVIDGHGATPMSDQYALAAIAHEWLFGRPIAHAADRPIETRSMPGVDRSALSKAFTRALSPKPEDRFASCAAFCDALNGAIVPELPLVADVDDFEAEGDAFLAQGGPNVDDLKISAEESILTAASFDSERENALLAQDKQPDLDAIDPRMSAPPPPVVGPSWHPSATPARTIEPQRFGAVALIVATLVGAIFGFAAGYMARPRALQSQPPQTFAAAPGTANEIAKAPEAPSTLAPGTKAPVAKAPDVSKAPENVGRLLVRSTPSGASVSVDGVARGVTPLALRELPLGTRDVSIARRGYIPETRKVTITKARPARTVDVRLAAAPQPVSPKPTGGSSAAKGRSGETATTGGLSIDSRPAGAAVTIDGKPGGTTPLTINDLAPGEYRIVMTMKGYRNFSTTVRVVAGERVRAAASLTALEQE